MLPPVLISSASGVAKKSTTIIRLICRGLAAVGRYNIFYREFLR